MSRILTAALLALTPSLALAAPTVTDPYAIMARPGAPSGGAFMTIADPDGAADRLIGASSPLVEKIELHTHEIDADGVARMIEVEEGFELPAGGELVLERGGLHLMLFGLSPEIADGTVIPVTLTFETAGEVQVDIPVDLSRLGGGMGQGMDHGAMDHATDGN